MTVVQTTAPDQIETVTSEIRSARVRLSEVPDDQLIQAWEWIVASKAVWKRRKIARRLLVEACQLELEILRRIGLSGNVSGLTATEAKSATYLAELDVEAFREAVNGIDATLTATTVVHRMKNADQQDLFDRLRRERRAEAAARALDNPQSLSYDSGKVREAATVLLMALAGQNTETPTADIVALLAEELDVDSSDEVVRRGLQALVIEAAGRGSPMSDADDDESVIQMPGEDPVYLDLPESLAFETDDGWVRVPWKVARMQHLRFLADLRRRQADDVMSAAYALEECAWAMETLGDRLGRHPSALLSETLRLATVEGWVSNRLGINSVRKAQLNSYKNFPKWGADVFSSHTIENAVVELMRRGVENEDGIRHRKPEDLIAVVTANSGPVTTDSFIRVYLDPSEGGWEHTRVTATYHYRANCQGSECAVHKRTNHHMRGWPQSYSINPKMRIVRTCEHDIEHPDPDESRAGVEHECDGCCKV